MSTESKIEHTLNDLIEIARDGQEFYTEAAQKVQNPELSALFVRIAGVKGNLVASLSGAVSASGGEPARHGTVVGSVQQFYGKVRAAFGDTQYGYVAELEESEDRLLGAFKDVLTDKDAPAAAVAKARELLPEVQQCHNEMRRIKLSMKNA